MTGPLEAITENFAGIGARIGTTAEDVMGTLVAGALPAVPFPPGLDPVSAMLPAVLGPYYASVAGCTADGVVKGMEGATTVPSCGVSYSGRDILNGEHVTTVGTVAQI